MAGALTIPKVTPTALNPVGAATHAPATAVAATIRLALAALSATSAIISWFAEGAFPVEPIAFAPFSELF